MPLTAASTVVATEDSDEPEEIFSIEKGRRPRAEPMPLCMAQSFMRETYGLSPCDSMGTGDCFVLSALAGHEITSARAKQPDLATYNTVREYRNRAVDLLINFPKIGGVSHSIFRRYTCLEGLDEGAVRQILAPCALGAVRHRRVCTDRPRAYLYMA